MWRKRLSLFQSQGIFQIVWIYWYICSQSCDLQRTCSRLILPMPDFGGEGTNYLGPFRNRRYGLEPVFCAAQKLPILRHEFISHTIDRNKLAFFIYHIFSPLNWRRWLSRSVLALRFSFCTRNDSLSILEVLFHDKRVVETGEGYNRRRGKYIPKASRMRPSSSYSIWILCSLSLAWKSA